VNEELLRQRMEDIERDRFRAVQRFEEAKKLCLDMKEALVERQKKISFYRFWAIFATAFASILLGFFFFFSFFPDCATVSFKGVNECLLNIVSTFRTDSKAGSPLNSSIPDATEPLVEIPVPDATTDGCGHILQEPSSADANLTNGSENLQGQDGSQAESSLQVENR